VMRSLTIRSKDYVKGTKWQGGDEPNMGF
jgi:hypothetical protein